MPEIHVCSFPEVKLDIGVVIAPCPTCGEGAGDYLDFLENQNDRLAVTLLQVEPHRPLYHWAPATRRKQIKRYGLRPNMRPTTSSDNHRRVPYICFADSPSWAWALSGGLRWTPTGEWDLWFTYMDRLVDPLPLPSSERPSGLNEVRTEFRVYKRELWYVGSRTKE
jgi:hypothetical protein